MTNLVSAAAIDLVGLSKTFRTRNAPAVPAIARVTWSVSAGQIVGVVGAPGAGKTTLLKLIAGQLRPTTGQTNLFGYDVIREAPLARPVVRLVSTDARDVRVRSTLRDTVLASADVSGPDRLDVESRTSEILEQLGLRDCVGGADAGQTSATWVRAALAIALIPDPRILLLDEPTAGLDDAEARAFVSTLAELGRSQRKTIVLATRHLALAREFCDRIVVLERGRLILDRRTSDPGWPRLEDVYAITVGGQLGDEWSDWFDGMRVDPTGTGATILIGPVPDQSALHGLLVKVRDLGLPLLALSRVEPDARDVLNLWKRSGGRFDGTERLSHNGRSVRSTR